MGCEASWLARFCKQTQRVLRISADVVCRGAADGVPHQLQVRSKVAPLPYVHASQLSVPACNRVCDDEIPSVEQASGDCCACRHKHTKRTTAGHAPKTAASVSTVSTLVLTCCSYGRWRKGRHAWGRAVVTCRNLMRQVQAPASQSLEFKPSCGQCGPASDSQLSCSEFPGATLPRGVF